MNFRFSAAVSIVLPVGFSLPVAGGAGITRDPPAPDADIIVGSLGTRR